LLCKYLQGNITNEGRELIHSLRRWQDKEPEVKEEKLKLDARRVQHLRAGRSAPRGTGGWSDTAGGAVVRSSPRPTATSLLLTCCSLLVDESWKEV